MVIIKSVPWRLVWFVFAAAGCMPASRPKSPPLFESLETTHVTLYDCGLAQYERQATVQGEMRLPIQTTTAHLDDLVSSLVLATDKNVRVTGVEYPSTQNLVQATSASGFAKSMISDAEGYQKPDDLAGYARALTGTEVVVQKRDTETVRGTMLDCVDEDAPKLNDDEDEPQKYSALKDERRDDSYAGKTLVLVEQTGALVLVALRDVMRIEPLSKREAEALRSFASQLGRTGGYTETEVTLTTAPGSSGKLAVSYIRQSPLWRTIYKITAGQKNVTLEAWAVVHNDTPEDWKDISMTLISGLPASYVMSTASPRYMERETLVLDEDTASMMPQLGSDTPDSILYPSVLTAQSSVMSGFGSGSGSGGGYTQGAGSLSGRKARAPVVSVERSSSLIALGTPAAEVQTANEVEGEISTYSAQSKVTVRAGASAMVPILRETLVGEAFVLLSHIDGSQKTCVRAVNDTGLVLQRGAASVFSDGRFRGQTEIEMTEPEETRIWCFGEDRDVSFSIREETTWQHRALEWRKNSLYVHGIKTTAAEYTVHNNAGLPRRLAVLLSKNLNGRFLLEEPIIEGEEDTSFLVMLDMAKRSNTVKTYRKEEGLEKSIVPSEASLTELLAEAAVSVAHKDVLNKALEQQKKIDAVSADMEAAQMKIDKFQAAIVRLKANLAAVPALEGSAATADMILRESMDNENRIVAMQETIERLRASIIPIQELRDQILSAVGTPSIVSGAE